MSDSLSVTRFFFGVTDNESEYFVYPITLTRIKGTP